MASSQHHLMSRMPGQNNGELHIDVHGFNYNTMSDEYSATADYVVQHFGRGFLT